MRALLLSGLLALASLPAAAQPAQNTLRIGIFEDFDVPDPALSRTFSGLQILSAMCDKLLDVTPDLRYVGAAAESFAWTPDGRGLVLNLRPGMRFQDGAPFDAEAVAFGINRHLTLQGSFRRGELPMVTGVTVLGPLTARIDLNEPSIPLLSLLVTRAGMMVSPQSAERGNPVCSGPYRLRERVALDRVVLERWPEHWNAAAHHIERIVYRPIPDGNIRLQNLRGGGLDLMERVSAPDLPTVRAQRNLRVAQALELGHSFIRFNIANGPGAEGPWARDARLRAALEASIDREALVNVVFSGEAVAGNQWVNPAHPLYARAHPVPRRDLARARALLAEAGQPRPTLRLAVPNQPELVQAAEVIQSMAAEAGIQVQVQAIEIGAYVRNNVTGQFEAAIGFWGGRTDADGNVSFHVTCRGPNNDGRYCSEEVEAALTAARREAEDDARRPHYAAAADRLLADRPNLWLWHRRNSWAFTSRLQGFTAYPDGIFRYAGLRYD
jgi:peptide/nickel transport system substrate-binding protein